MADDDEAGPSEAEVRAALAAVRTPEVEISHVLTLASASEDYAVPLLPAAALDAVIAVWITLRDVGNGGMDQVVWNHGAESSKQYAAAWRTVGATENADLVDKLVAVLEDQLATSTDAQREADPIEHFLAFRRAVNGPSFGTPVPSEELGDPLLAYVLAHLDEVPLPDAPLPRDEA